jgi:hypothetical protein
VDGAARLDVSALGEPQRVRRRVFALVPLSEEERHGNSLVQQHYPYRWREFDSRLPSPYL